MDEKKRKKWTPVAEPDEMVLKVREKRKWQIALRRYLIEQNKCLHYAPYFSLDSQSFRDWIACQFKNGLDWSNFSKSWQIDHVIPVNYFDFSIESDLRLCWNFVNIRVNDISREGSHFDLLAARQYFEELYLSTRYPLCVLMIDKINSILSVDKPVLDTAAHFINDKREYIETLSGFEAHEFLRLNEGVELAEVLAERNLLKNFG